jgi:hypothetical protein
VRVAGLVAIVVAVLAQSVTAANAASPLVAQYHLDETNPAADLDKTAHDSSGNGLNATSTYNFDPVAGKFSGAMGSPGEYVTTPSPTADVLTSPPQLTLLAWIKQTGNPGNTKYIAGRGNDGNACTGGSYGLYNGFSPTAPGPRFWIKTNTTVNGNGSVWSGSPSDPNTALYDGQWHLLAGTFDGTALRLYIDGVQQGADVNVPTGAIINYAIPGQTSTYFFIKSYPVGACQPYVGTFPGPIDEVRLYDRALTQTELARLAAAPDGGSPPDLIPDSTTGPPSGGSPNPGGAGANPGTAGKKCKKHKKKHRSAAASKKKKGCKKKKH